MKKNVDYRPFCNLYKGDCIYALKLSCYGNLSDVIHFELNDLVKDIGIKKIIINNRVETKNYIKFKIGHYPYYFSFKKGTEIYQCKRMEISIYPVFSDKNAARDYLLEFLKTLKRHYNKLVIRGSIYSKGHRMNYIRCMPLIYDKIKTL